ncbi:MAG TPA: Gfo/Idh/MocA family oxidoreductase [Limnochordia bacterium]|nr:Gfo/Idh/MocA family oxidoreductase [Limnochordia bacterium]
MSNPIRIGIIGSGGIAHSHARAYKQIPEATIVAVADVVPGKAAAFIADEGLEGAQALEDHNRLLELELDGVSVCTPNIAHHRASVDALNAGKHVIVEKPMSFTLEQGVEMVQAAKRNGKILTVGFQPRYDPNFQNVKQIVQSGRLGRIYYVETGGGRRRGIPGGTFIRKELAGTGAIGDLGCYSLDFALDCLGYPKPLTVTAVATNHFGTSPRYAHGWKPEDFTVEDFGAAFIRLEGGVELLFKMSWAMHLDKLNDSIFLGTEAGLKMVPQKGGPWSGSLEDIDEITVYHDLEGHHTASPIPVVRRFPSPFVAKVRAFVEAIATGGPAPIPGEQILRQQAIIDGILRSSEARKEVAIHIPEV